MSYVYDAAGRLTGAEDDDSAYNYTYDANGNRTRKTAISGGAYVDYTWDHHNRLTDVEFRTSGGTLTKKVHYTYDVNDRLIRKQVDDNGDSTYDRAQKFVYDDRQIVLVFDDSDALQHRYLTGPVIDQIFADETAVGDILWSLSDNLGTVRDVAQRNTGTGVTSVVNHLKYDSFGKITAQSDSSKQPLFAYTGLMFDEDSELQWSRARWYDAMVGRFISEDPIGFDAGDLNLQRYVGNAPLTHTDPTGRSAVDDYGNWANDLTGGLYGSIGNWLYDGAIAGGVSNNTIAGASDGTLVGITAGVAVGAVAGGELVLGVGSLPGAVSAAGTAVTNGVITAAPGLTATLATPGGQALAMELGSAVLSGTVTGIETGSVQEGFKAGAADFFFSGGWIHIGNGKYQYTGFCGTNGSCVSSDACFVAGTPVIVAVVDDAAAQPESDSSITDPFEIYLWLAVIAATAGMAVVKLRRKRKPGPAYLEQHTEDLPNEFGGFDQMRNELFCESAQSDEGPRRSVAEGANVGMFPSLSDKEHPPTRKQPLSTSPQVLKRTAPSADDWSWIAHSIQEPSRIGMSRGVQPKSRLGRISTDSAGRTWGTSVAGALCLLVAAFIAVRAFSLPARATTAVTAFSVQTPAQVQMRAIETIRVGDRVVTDGSSASSSATNVNPATWRLLRLESQSEWDDATIDDITVETLQPPEWVRGHRAHAGAMVPLPLDLTEMGLPKGLRARVVSNDPCPPLKSGQGRIVLTTVNHLNDDLFELTLQSGEGRHESLRTTGHHKFYSIDRQDWVAANDLSDGERLRGIECSITLVRAVPIPGTHRVYNMTVEGDHVYRVASLGVLVHNNCQDILMPGGKPIGNPGSSPDIREVPGGLPAAKEMFGDLTAGGSIIGKPGYPGTPASPPEGGFIGLRPESGSNDPAIDISIPGIPIKKIHFGQ